MTYKKLFLMCLLINAGISVKSQPSNLALILHFDGSLAIETHLPGLARQASVNYQDSVSYSQGIHGKALDLSSAARWRYPVNIPAGLQIPDRFGVRIWIKTTKNALLGNTIASNRVSISKTAKGWTISTQTNGSWKWNLSDGSTEFVYSPTSERQPVNDGSWHQLAFVVDRIQQKVKLYYDGKNVAMYHLGSLNDFISRLPVSIGSGTQSENTEMDSFNGMIDEFEISSRGWTDAEIRTSYNQYSDKPVPKAELAGDQLKILSWNIWHGGREHGNIVGVQRVIDVIKKANPDVITMIETYGSGAKIADALGYYFYLRSSNLAIFSRYPFGKTIDVFKPFNCGGIYLDLGNNRKIAVVDTWLNYLPDYRKEMRTDSLSADDIYVNEGNTRYAEIRQILKQLELQIKQSGKIPLIMAGDFNSPSHLDFTRKMSGKHWGYSIEWPVTVEMEEAGFHDSFRKMYPDPKVKYGGTQPSHIFNTFHYRIDYIFYMGKKLKPVNSEVVTNHPVKFPSDHDAVLTTFELKY